MSDNAASSTSSYGGPQHRRHGPPRARGPRSQAPRRHSVAWCPPGASYQPSIHGLDRELRDFAHYVSLRPDEVMARHQALSDFKATLETLWPDATFTVFGSFSFGLSLGSSDIDVAVRGVPDESSDTLRALCDHIALSPAFTCDLFVEARIPLIKTVHEVTGVRLDLSLNAPNVDASIAAQREFLSRCPDAAPVIMVCKALLRQWGLGSVFTGGLSSTALYLLVERFFALREAARAKLITPPPSVSPASPAASEETFPALPGTAPSTPRSLPDDSSASSPGRSPGPSSVSSTDGARCRRASVGTLLIEFFQHCCAPCYAEGFVLIDRHNVHNEVSRGTKRTLQLQALMQHAHTVLDYLARQGGMAQKAPGTPLTMLSALAADPRAPSAREEEVRVKVGSHVVA